MGRFLGMEEKRGKENEGRVLLHTVEVFVLVIYLGCTRPGMT